MGDDAAAAPPLANIANFRDVGKTINHFLGERRIREGLLFRSARPDEATMRDRKILTEDLGIKTVLDLRTKTEHYNAAKKRDATLALPSAIESNAALAEPVQIQGVKYNQIRITGDSFERFVISQTSWRGFISIMAYMAIGKRTEGIQVLAREVMNPRGLVHMGLDNIDHAGPTIADAVRSAIEPPGLPLLVHCNAGKDRTGLIVCLILLVLGIPLEAIAHDYHLSDEGLKEKWDELVADTRKYGLDDSWATTGKGQMEAIDRHIREEHGGVEAYLDRHGFSDDECKQLRKKLLY